MLNIAICDDCPAEREHVKELLEKYSFEQNIDIRTSVYENGSRLLDDYKPGEFHIIILDIELDETMDGIEIAQAIRSLPDRNVIIIYLSSYPNYMPQSFRVHASQFLIKPITYEVLSQSLTELLDFVSGRELYAFSGIDDTIYAFKDDIILITSNPLGKSINTVQTSSHVFQAKGPLRNFLADCPNHLVMPNRSQLVGTSHITRIDAGCVYLDNGTTVPVARRKAAALQSEIATSIERRNYPWK